MYARDNLHFRLVLERKSKLAIAELLERLSQRVDAKIKRVRAESVEYLADGIHLSVHGPVSPLVCVISRSKPFKIRSHAAIHFHLEPVRRGHGARAQQNSLDRMRQRFGRFPP